ncbi:MAG: vWA domain-containing protein, partial [Candidatus Micrarchaeia archaeon]
EDSDSAEGSEASKNSRSGRGSKNDRDTGEEEQENAAEPSENTGKDKAADDKKKEQQGEAANSEDGNNAHNGGLDKIAVLLSKIKNMIEGKADKKDPDQNAEPKEGNEEEKNDGSKDNKNKGNNPKDPNEDMKKQNDQDKEPNFFTVKSIDRNSKKEKNKNNGALRGEVLGYGIGRGADEPAMLWVPHVEAVRETYERNATQTVLEFLKDDNNKKIMPSGSVIYTARRVESEKLPYARIDYGKTRFVPGEGGGEDVWMYEKRQLSPRADMPENLQPTSFKDLLFIVDTSGSMLWSGKALDGFEYDLAVRSVFSILKYLEYTKKAAYLNYGLIQFSNHTLFSGWKDFNHVKELKNALIERYEGGRTTFNPNALYLAASQKSDKFLAILISDTWIYNNTETIEAFKNVMREGNDVAILQIGGFAKFTGNLEPLSVELARSGATVRLLTDPSDLVELSLRITKDRYVERTESGIRGFAVNEHIKV